MINQLSIVVPTLNEERILGKTLSMLKLTNEGELIVSDGGSTDHTVSIAREFTDNVFVTTTGKGRGHAMNYGAKRAHGEILLFLHADCILPHGAFMIIRETLNNNGVAAGAFNLSIDHPAFRFRVIEAGANLRSRITAIPYGDQGIFMKKELFDRLGGFADIALMEDIEISRRMKNLGKIVFVGPPIKASARRWLMEGVFHTTFRDWFIALSYSFLRRSPLMLKKYYRDIR
jgi:rSAM/selenodomain-associated transferase 2